ncbi:MAG: hypothetical protein AAGI30_05405 [Planctomycetota bacterium]
MTRVHLAVLGALALPIALIGCAGERPAVDPFESANVWVPAAEVEVVSIDRRSIFAIGPSDAGQVLVVTRGVDDPARLPGTEQWVLELPLFPPMNEPIEVGEGTEFEAVAIELLGTPAAPSGPGRSPYLRRDSRVTIGPDTRLYPTNAVSSAAGVPVRGTVIVESIGPDEIVAVIDLVADAQPRDAGVINPVHPSLTGRYTLPLTVVPAVASVQPYARSGVPHLTRGELKAAEEAGSIYSAESFKEVD